MFSNLSQGNVLYGLDTRGDFKIFAVPVTKASAPYAGYVNNNGIQIPSMVVDIAANIDGEVKEFKQVPSNISIADFGTIGFILADNKDSLKVYIDSMVSSKRKIVESIEKEKHLYEQYLKVSEDISDQPNNTKDNDEIKQLRSEIAELKELLTLRKSETT